ncbi:hypothetical protein THRCLA_06164 [Thraustotheca clavata]|uniref:Uncharacterized protein n=1 Tax=Thraustotheca clavata TaxID=74557 RepID=A0A1V9ZQ86_9STRA|nr:hypothetical protein THRCLA_06164 [Thraustotheca clavata]
MSLTPIWMRRKLNAVSTALTSMLKSPPPKTHCMTPKECDHFYGESPLETFDSPGTASDYSSDEDDEILLWEPTPQLKIHDTKMPTDYRWMYAALDQDKGTRAVVYPEELLERRHSQQEQAKDTLYTNIKIDKENQEPILEDVVL